MTNSNTSNQNSTILVLSILTIVGSVVIMIKGLVGYSILEDARRNPLDEYSLFFNAVYIAEFLSCLLAIVGAALMLGGKKVGLIIYMVSSILYVVATFAFAIFCFLSIIGFFVGLIQILYLIVSVLFLVLYLTHSKHLR